MIFFLLFSVNVKHVGVNLEDFGGDVQSVAISALKGTNINLLIEAILAQVKWNVLVEKEETKS